MINKLEIKEIMYLNLFERITKVRAKYCFSYNNSLFFVVDRNFFNKSLGRNKDNVKKIKKILNKNVRVIIIPKKEKDAIYFIKSIINPIKIGSLKIKENEIIINPGKNKALLIGKKKKNFLELRNIVKNFFNKELKII
ncbi:MAG: hypothetical protein KatS3mg001_558 [Candidatus Pacearchaeota archaeon]|nr:MAG: hypothetical protein KatS3mg001_558 [Candidatus Pacearchaeota archaeon]